MPNHSGIKNHGSTRLLGIKNTGTTVVYHGVKHQPTQGDVSLGTALSWSRKRHHEEESSSGQETPLGK